MMMWVAVAYAGIGRALCQSLLSAGAVIYALDKCKETLDRLVAEVHYVFFLDQELTSYS